MKPIHLLFAATLLLAFAACNKDKESDKNPTCYWTINGEGFQSNQTFKEVGKAVTNFGVLRNLPDRFECNFWVSGVPEYGIFHISDTNIQDPSTVIVSIRRQGKIYGVSEHLTHDLSASYVDHKARLQFQDVWFRNTDQPTDTILVSCDLYAKAL